MSVHTYCTRLHTCKYMRICVWMHVYVCRIMNIPFIFLSNYSKYISMSVAIAIIIVVVFALCMHVHRNNFSVKRYIRTVFYYMFTLAKGGTNVYLNQNLSSTRGLRLLSVI